MLSKCGEAEVELGNPACQMLAGGRWVMHVHICLSVVSVFALYATDTTRFKEQRQSFVFKGNDHRV
jgi:hypothetical protein